MIDSGEFQKSAAKVVGASIVHDRTGYPLHSSNVTAFGNYRRMPCSEVLRREIAVGRRAQVVVDIGRGQIAPATSAAIGEKALVCGPVPAQGPDNCEHLRIGDCSLLPHAVLARIVEEELAVAAADVLPRIVLRP